MSEWQPIETTPENTSEINPIDVWVCHNDGFGFRVPDVFWCNEQWVQWVDGEPNPISHVTHWMSLPAPPKVST